MSSHTRMRQREEERRLSIRTLAIAALASAAAAVVTSQFWIAGTPIAAAITPVIVTLISELLHRPTAVLAERLTSDRTAILPDAGGAAPPPPRDADPLPRRAPADPGGEPGVTVYRQAPRRGRRIAVGVVVTTAVLAFAIAAVALTVPELIAGGSIGKRGGGTSLFGGGRDKDRDEPEQPPPPQQTAPQEEPTTPQETETVPTETETVPTETETTPTETVP